MEAPETDKSFGLEGCVLDLYGRMLRDAPVSTRKFLPETESGKKSKFELATVELQAVADGGKTMTGRRRRRGAGRRRSSLGTSGISARSGEL